MFFKVKFKNFSFYRRGKNKTVFYLNSFIKNIQTQTKQKRKKKKPEI